jgi:hypothetical protein
MTLLSFGIAIFTPPISGQFCRGLCISYPYQDIAARFPRDYLWMFPAMVATLFFVAMMVGLHARAVPEKRPFATLAVVLSGMAGLVLVADYFLQLAVIQPSVLAGEAGGISLLTQYNPHGLFIALEELGYLLMAFSLACMAPAISAASRLERMVRWLFVGGLMASLLALLWIALRLGHGRGYLFEVAVISIDWLVLIISGFMLAVLFHRDAVRLVGAVPLTAAS